MDGMDKPFVLITLSGIGAYCVECHGTIFGKKSTYIPHKSVFGLLRENNMVALSYFESEIQNTISWLNKQVGAKKITLKTFGNNEEWVVNDS